MDSATSLPFLLSLFQLTNVLFACAFGACIGSLINVLVYRMPLGLGVVTPPSRCPSCETQLTWRENIPIVGWILLRGRCRFCRSPVSIEYPIVELVVALIFGAVYLKCYSEGTFLWISFDRLEPAWAWAGFGLSSPMFISILVLISCLVTATIIDARTFQIPLVLTWVPTAAALIAHPVTYYIFQYSHHGGMPRRLPGWDWVIASPGPGGWAWAGAAVGGVLGLAIGNLLLYSKVFRRSFSDYEAWATSSMSPQPPEASGEESTHRTPKSLNEQPDLTDPAKWLEYPHARREMVRELIFLAPCIGLALAGAAIAIKIGGPWTFDVLTGDHTPARSLPPIVSVVCSVLMGYLIGGGLVWLWRLLGTFYKGIEALGLGDVHLMAAVGACLGWPTAVLGFFAAAFVGVFWAVFSWPFTRRFSKQLPFGPYLAIGTMLVWYFHPWVEQLLGWILRMEGPLRFP